MNDKDKKMYRDIRASIDTIFGIDRLDIKKDLNDLSRDFRKLRDKVLKQSQASLEEWVENLTIQEVLDLIIALEKRFK